MSRDGRSRIGSALAAMAALLAALAFAGAGAAAEWTTVPGTIPGAVTDAVADGPRTLVTSADRRRLIVTTLARGRVTRRQVVATARIGTVEGLRVLALRRGAALAVWGEGVGVRSSYRPSAGARFGPVRGAVPWTAGTARPVVVAATPGGAVLAAWWGGPAGGRLGIYAAELGSGGTWGAPTEISAGTYPALPPGPPPIVAIAATPTPDGGFGVVWRQPEGSGPASTTRIAAVTRSPTGRWAVPAVLGVGDVTSFTLTATASAPGEVVGAWAEGRARRPDGVVSETCAIVASAGPGGGVVRRELGCRAASDSGRLILAATRSGATLAGWRQATEGEPFRSSITLFSRAARSGEWSPGTLIIADDRRFSELQDIAPLPGGGALLAVDLGVGSGARRGGRARVIVVDDAGEPGRRVRGPVSLPVPSRTTIRLRAFGARHGAILAAPEEGYPYRSRVSLLTLGPA